MKTLPPSIRISNMNRRKAPYNAALILQELRFFKDADPTVVDSGPFRQMWEDASLLLNSIPRGEYKRAMRWATSSFTE